MFIEFSVANYRSFKDRVTLSLVASTLKAKTPQVDLNSTFDVDGQLRLVKSAAIYGANASGKSNIIMALNFMKGLMINSSRESQSTDFIDVEPFRLSAVTEHEPSEFEIVFRHEGVIYRYGFQSRRDRIVKEWLFYVPSVRETRLFERNLDEFKISKKYGADGIQKFTRNNSLFLSVCAQFNIAVAKAILIWIENNLQITSGLTNQSFSDFTLYCLESQQYKSEIINFINKLDTGIYDLEVEKFKLNSQSFSESTPTEIRDAILQETGGFMRVIKTVHQKFNQIENRIDWEIFDLKNEESDGTRKIFAMAAPIIHTLKSGIILVVDELDARLHPLISQAIIKLFNSHETNPNHAQLIFTTHDTNLLDNQMFRRDQIWFTEKDRYAATDLYSLAEYKIRNDASFERDYIQGKYGAIPYLGNLENLVDTSA
jgi:AAA15 family ATPase/GTPase